MTTTVDVGIGNEDPSAALDVDGDVILGPKLGNGSVSVRYAATTSTVGSLSFVNGNDVEIGRISYSGHGPSTGDMRFFTWASGLHEAMVIYSDGSVGIGTTTPVATLDVAGTARLARYSAAPHACTGTEEGVIAMTSSFTLCACDGAGWVDTSDGSTACVWD